MGTFSIWHWLIVLIVVAMHLIPVAMASKDKRLARLPYFYRMLALIVVGFMLEVLGEASDNPSAIIIVMLIGVGILLWVMQLVWSVHRAQDIGWPKWWTLLFVVPGANLIYLLLLLFWRSRKIEA